MWLQGTSMASPHAAGVAALIVSRGVTNPDEVERILKKTSKHPNNVEWDKEYGAGVIDALAAVDASTESYAPERAGLAGLLGLAGLASLGTAALSRRRRILGVASPAVVGAGLAAGAFGCAPIAYNIAGVTGSVAAFGSPLILSALLPLLCTLLLFGVPQPPPAADRPQPRQRRHAPARRDRPPDPGLRPPRRPRRRPPVARRERAARPRPRPPHRPRLTLKPEPAPRGRLALKRPRHPGDLGLLASAATRAHRRTPRPPPSAPQTPLPFLRGPTRQ
jgi:hypothetical protein